MSNTARSFEDKWSKNPNLFFKETLDENSDILQWILKRNGFDNLKEFKEFLGNKKRVLDAGCGNGRITALFRENASQNTEIVGIDLVSSDIAKDNLKDYQNVTFYKKDLMNNLNDLGEFDFIYCQEVLHHTKDPKNAFRNLCGILSENGEIAIYVYKKKAPIREFVDDYIRDTISSLSYEDAIKVCNQITEFGKVLSEYNIKINVPRIDMLEIQEGEFDLQRFFYYFFIKCFWNDKLSFEDNNLVNYDWYHPQDCSRHTIDEVKNWFLENKITIIHENVDFYGITIRGKK